LTGEGLQQSSRHYYAPSDHFWLRRLCPLITALLAFAEGLELAYSRRQRVLPTATAITQKADIL
jgi:hypothetical protein